MKKLLTFATVVMVFFVWLAGHTLKLGDESPKDLSQKQEIQKNEKAEVLIPLEEDEITKRLREFGLNGGFATMEPTLKK